LAKAGLRSGNSQRCRSATGHSRPGRAGPMAVHLIIGGTHPARRSARDGCFARRAPTL